MFRKIAFVAATIAVATISSAQSQDRKHIQVGFSEVMRMATVPGNIIIGDPSIADINLLERSPHIILSGRSLGVTNMLVLDNAGNEILNAVVEVIPVGLAPRASLVRVVDRIHRVKEYVCRYGSGCHPARETRVRAEADPAQHDQEIQHEEDRPADVEGVPVS